MTDSGRASFTAPAFDPRELDRSRFFSEALDLFCIAGTDGYFKHVNPAWERVLRYSRAELLATPYLDFVHPDDRAATRAAALELERGRPAAQFENRYRAKDGAYRWIAWRAVSLRDEPFVFVTARDVTDEKKAAQLQAAQYAVARVLAEAVDLPDAAPRILQAVCEHADWKVGALWAVDETATLLRCAGFWQLPTVDVAEFAAATGVMTFPPGIGLPGRVWASGQAAWIPDVTQDRNFPRVPIAASSGIRAGFAFPIRSGSTVIGVAEFFAFISQPPDEGLLKGMAVVGDHIGQFVARRKLEAERERLVADLQEAMANLKLLRGLLPICATCKNIRDQAGRWYRLEDYISAHSEARFTHGICSDCARKVHPDWDAKP